MFSMLRKNSSKTILMIALMTVSMSGYYAALHATWELTIPYNIV